MKIWTLDDNLLDKIVDTYIDYVTNPYSIQRQTSIWFTQNIGNKKNAPEYKALRYDKSIQASMDYGDNNLPIKILNLPKPQPIRIKAHFISLIHQLYLRHISLERGGFMLSSEILQKVYRNYNFMIDALTFKLIIQRTRESVGDFARDVYCIDDVMEKKFKYVECKNRIVIEDINKIISQFNEIHANEIKKAVKITSSKFIESYNKSLKTYNFKYEKGVQDFIDNYSFKSYRAKLYYENIINKIKYNKIKQIDKADNNGRFYHIVTETPKLIRNYTNIKFTIDTKNSHPLLFNYFILEYYINRNNIDINNNKFININNSLYYYIFNYIYNNNQNNIHYFSKDLCNQLNINGIKRDKNVDTILKRIPKDVWSYLYSTTHGRLWDEINESYPNFTRDEIKVEMFRSLFYSNSKNIRQNNEYAKAFQVKYPTVAKIIRHYKSTYHAQCIDRDLFTEINIQNDFFKKSKKTIFKKGKIQLAHKLMQLESFIFTEILKTLYKKETFRGVAIHDAIAVLDENTSSDEVRMIMEKVYFRIGLCPTFSIEKNNNECGTTKKKI